MMIAPLPEAAALFDGAAFVGDAAFFAALFELEVVFFFGAMFTA